VRVRVAGDQLVQTGIGLDRPAESVQYERRHRSGSTAVSLD
jgi:hypothetical protein